MTDPSPVAPADQKYISEEEAFRKPTVDKDGYISEDDAFGNTRSALGEVATGFKRGVIGDLPQMVGQAAEWATDPNGSPISQKINAWGKGVSDAAEERLNRPENQLHREKHNVVTNALASGAEMIPQSVVPAAAVGAGVALLPEAIIGAGGGAAGLALASLGGAIPAGMSQAQQTYEAVKKVPGKTDEEAKTAGWKSGAIETLGESLGTYIGGKFVGFGGKALGLGKTAEKTIGRVAADATDPAVAKPFFKAFASTALEETATEMGQNYGEAVVEKNAGVNTDPWTQAKASIEPTLGMTALLAPFGLAHNFKQGKHAQAIDKALSDPNAASPEVRAGIVDALHQEAVDRKVPDADQWFEGANQDIENGLPIRREASPIQEQTTETPDVQQQPSPISAPAGTTDSWRNAQDNTGLDSSLDSGPLSKAVGITKPGTVPSGSTPMTRPPEEDLLYNALAGKPAGTVAKAVEKAPAASTNVEQPATPIDKTAKTAKSSGNNKEISAELNKHKFTGTEAGVLNFFRRTGKLPNQGNNARINEAVSSLIDRGFIQKNEDGSLSPIPLGKNPVSLSTKPDTSIKNPISSEQNPISEKPVVATTPDKETVVNNPVVQDQPQTQEQSHGTERRQEGQGQGRQGLLKESQKNKEGSTSEPAALETLSSAPVLSKDEKDTHEFLSRQTQPIIPNEKNKPIYDSLVQNGLAHYDDATKSYGPVETPTKHEVINNPESVVHGHEINTAPTEEQAKAGNYKKGHVNLDGMDISVENPAGSTRTGTDKSGRTWSTKMNADYGYIKGSVGFDKDHVDVVLSPGYQGGSKEVYVVNQHKDNGKGGFDEHKAVLGATSRTEAMKIYNSNYEEGWSGGKNVVKMSMERFKEWVKSHEPKSGPAKSERVKKTRQNLSENPTKPVGKSEPTMPTLEQLKTHLADMQKIFEQNGSVVDSRLDRKIKNIKSVIADIEKKNSTVTPQESKPDFSKRDNAANVDYRSGQVVETATGRKTTPFPTVDYTSDRRARTTVVRIDTWLLDNAIEEAKSRQDEFAVRQFEDAMQGKIITLADKDFAKAYLFNKNLIQKPQKPFLKDLVTKEEKPIVSGQSRPVPERPGLSYVIHNSVGEFNKRLGKYVASITKDNNSLVAPLRGYGDTEQAALDRAIDQLKPAEITPVSPQTVTSRASETFQKTADKMYDSWAERIQSAIDDKMFPQQYKRVPSKEALLAYAEYQHSPNGQGGTGHDLMNDLSAMSAEEYAKWNNTPSASTEVPASAPQGVTSSKTEEPTLVIRSLQTGKEEHVAIKDLKGKSSQFANNKIFTSDAVARARERLAAKRNTLSSGFDPELMQDMVIIGGAHFEAGIRNFAAWSKAVLSDIGKEFAPFLRGTYENIRHYPGLNTEGISTSAEIEAHLTQESKSNTLEEKGGVDHGKSENDTESGLEGGPIRQDDKTTSDGGQTSHEGVASEGVSKVDGGKSPTDNDAKNGEKSPQGNKTTGRVRIPKSRSGRSNNEKIHTPTAGERSPGRDGEDGRGLTEEPSRIPAINFEITDEVQLGKGGETQKFNDNIAAIRIIKKLEAERRLATAEEQMALARYVGWGGMSNAFENSVTKETNEKWKDKAAVVKELLTPEEYDVARNSTQAAHYTSETIVSGIWDALKQLGFKGGNALEPSVGTGNFIGLMPKEISGNTNLLGVEYDNITAAIAKHLYPQSSIIHSGFEEIPLPKNFFDLVVGNPPFGKKSLNFRHNPDINRASIHNQFFLAGIESLKPGGIQAMVVSRYFMDAADSSTRETISRSSKILGAIRLPDTAFKENARTDVVTDIIFLQKLTESEIALREGIEMRSKSISKPYWTQTVEIEDPAGGEKMRVNSFFQKNPNSIIGTMDRTGSMQYGGDITVHFDGDLKSELHNKIKEILPSDIARHLDPVEKSHEQFKNMKDAMEIHLAGHEDGSIFHDDLGRLTQVTEREIEGGDTIKTKRILTPESVWSPNLSMDSNGKWYREIDKLNEKGKPEKVVVNGKRTSRNVKVREVFENEKDIPSSMKIGERGLAILNDAVSLLGKMQKQIQLETGNASTEEIEAHRELLSVSYDAFVNNNGHVHSRVVTGVVSGMPNEALLMSFEKKYKAPVTSARAKKLGIKPRDAIVEKADILNERVCYPYEAPSSAKTGADALAISLSENGRVDIYRMADLLGKSKEETIAELHDNHDHPLIFMDPEKQVWQTADEYLSGNVVRKLQAAIETGMKKNIAALKEIQPEKWGAENITPNIGSAWIPTDVYADFVQHITGEKARVMFSPLTNTFTVEGKSGSVSAVRWDTPRMQAHEIIERLLNSKTIKIMMTEGYGSDKRTVLDSVNTDLAIDKAEELKREYDNWIFNESARRDKLVDLFNQKYNVRVIKQRNGDHLTLPGKVPDVIIKMRRHQLNAIWRGVTDKFTLYDHAVGAGKTFTAIARVMERRRMGFSQKPMIVVPNHLVGQFSADVLKLYPGAKMLAADKNDLVSKNRRRFFAKIATGDHDVVILPHSSFSFIGISRKTEERYLNEALVDAENAIKEAREQAAEDGTDSGWSKPLGVKMAENLRDSIKNKLSKLADRAGTKDKLLTFEQLGVDDLTIDEAHEFKNLFYNSKLTNVRGMNPQVGSGKAYDLWTKVRTLRENGNGSVVFMTGTPISNSAVEMYSLMKYLAADELEEMGLSHFDAWRNQFSTTSTKFEPTDSGKGLKEVNRIGRDWSNMRSLMDLYYSFSDSVSNDDIIKAYSEDNHGKPFPIPEIKGGGRVGVNVEPTPAQRVEIDRIVSGFDGLPYIQDIDTRNAERLRLMDQARKVSLDVRAVNPLIDSDEKGGKLERVAQEVHRIYKQWSADKGTQLLFCDRGVPKSKGDSAKIKEYDALIAKIEKAEAEGDENLGKLIDKLDKFDQNEMKELKSAQAGGWNAYDQIKKNLISLGIPANEIRFIQEADTDIKKQELFEEVNSGAIRVLIGSTPKMGAGTNVQERLVGLHHVDVTWKPSDIEQREGRIIRQGNSLYDKYGKSFQAEILAYTTNNTVDAKLWSLNSTKLKMINGIRKYSGDFNMEFDDEDSVSMAEIAAIASGDPQQLERVQLQADIDKLHRKERAYRQNMWGVKSMLESRQHEANTLPAQIELAKKAKSAVDASQGDFDKAAAERKVVIEGKTYTGKDFWSARSAIDELKPQKIKEVETIEDVKTNLFGNNKKTQKNTTEKPTVEKFSAEIDGKMYTNVEKAINYVEKVLGTATYPIEIAGKTYLDPTEVRQKIADAANDVLSKEENGGKLDLKIKISGLDTNIWIEPGDPSKNKGQHTFEYYIQSLVDGKKIFANRYESLATLAGKAHKNMPGLFFNVEEDTKNLRRRIFSEEQRLKTAIESLPELEKKVNEPFVGQKELEEKEARLSDLESHLAAVASAQNAKDKAERDAAEGGEEEEEGPKLSVTQKSTTGTDLSELKPDQRQVVDDLQKNGKLTVIRTDQIEQALLDAGVSPSQAKYMVAYHGSPHDFEKFSSDRIGTGEGAQAYGNGLYFAGHKEVAEFYREKLSPNRKYILFDGKAIDPSFDTKKIAEQYKINTSDAYRISHIEGLLQFKSKDEVASLLQRRIDSLQEKGDEGGSENYRRMLDFFDKNKDRFSELKSGKLYEVDLKPSEDEYLLWDKPLSEQSEKVKSALNDFKEQTVTSLDNEEDDYLEGEVRRFATNSAAKKFIKEQEIIGKFVNVEYANKPSSGDSVYQSLTRELGSDQAASEYLHSLGIRGIKYLDGSSRGKGEGNYNYVIFNDADAEITAKYSQDGKVQGFALPDGRSFIVPENIDKGQMWGVVNHEVGVHVGKLLHDQKGFNNILNSLESRINENSETGRAIKKAFAQVPADTRAELRAEEALAYLVQNHPEVGFVRRVIAMVKKALVQLGINPDIFTAKDFAALADMAVRREAKAQPSSNALQLGHAKYSQAQIMAHAKAFFSKLAQVSSDKFTGMKAQGVENFLLKQGVKKAEIEATGIKEWLAGMKPTDKVTKEQLSDFVKANTVAFKDVVLGEGGDYVLDENGKRIYDRIGGFITRPNRTAFSEYTEPGSKEGSYREMFVTAPVVGTAVERQSLTEPLWTDGHAQYAGIKNPIVRIRFNEVTDSEGRKILRVEEMQGPSDTNQKNMPKYLRDNIYQTGVKRIITYAKENGFDGVALSTRPGMTAGETQANRYSLETVADYIKATKNKDGSWYIKGMYEGHNQFIKGDVTDKTLPGLVGRELAKKIIKDGGGQYSGIDLKVGGEGLKSLYDTQLPKIFESYGGVKMGEVKVDNGSDGNRSARQALNTAYSEGRLTIEEYEAEKNKIRESSGESILPYIPITDKTPSSFPMFAQSSPFKKVTEKLVNSEAFKKWFGDSKITAEGKPAVLYHGTPGSEFLRSPTYDWIFDTNRPTKPDSSPFAGLGIFLGDDTIATGHAGPEGTVAPFFVRIENPKILTSDQLSQKVTDLESAKAYKKQLMELGGHDGIIIKDRGQVIAFNENQLKSAEKNTGEFSLNNNDVRYSIWKKATDQYDEHVKEAVGTFNERMHDKPDLPFLSKLISTPEYYFKKFPAAWKMFQAQLDRHTKKFTIENDILDDYVPFMTAAQKESKADYDRFGQYVRSVDKSGKSFNVSNKAMARISDPAGRTIGYAKTQLEASRMISKDAQETGNHRKDYTGKKVTLWTVIDRDGKEIGTMEEEKAAVQQMIDAESDFMREEKISEKAIGMTRRFRVMTNQAFDYMIEDLRKVEREMKSLGVEEPTVDIPDETRRWAVLKDGHEVGAFGSEADARGAIKIMRLTEKTTHTKPANYDFKKKTDSEITDTVLISKLMAQMSDLRGSYFPRQRPPGGVILRAVKGQDKIMEKYDLYAAGSKNINPETGEQVPSRPMSEFLRKKFNEATGYIPFVDTLEKRAKELQQQGYNISVEKDTSSPETVFEPMHLMSSMESLFQKAKENAQEKGNRLDEKGVAEVSKLLSAYVADIFKGRGYMSSRLKRSSEYWRGFEEDPLRAGTQYARGIAGGISKRDSAKQMMAAVTGRDVSWNTYQNLNPDAKWGDYIDEVEKKRIDPSTQPRLYSESLDFMREMLRNQEQVDRVVGTLKGLAVVKFLGFRVSSAVVNATNMVLAVPATISSQSGGTIRGALNSIRNSMTQYAQYRRKNGNLSAEDRAVFQTIVNNGWDEAQFNQENAAVLMSKLGRGWSKFGEWSMKMFGAVEKVNRATTIFAAYKEIMKNNPGMTSDQAMEKAKHVSDRAHGVYGKSTMPSWVRGSNLLKMAYTFQKFNHNYLLNMAEMGLKGDYTDAAYMLLSPAILGGVGATLAAPLMFGLLGKTGLAGDDPEEAFYSWIKKVFGSDEIARHGLPGLMGLNMKGSLDMQNPMPKKLSELMGAPGAILTDTYKAAQHFKKGEVMKGSEALLPTAIGSAVKAVREGTEGVTTGSYGSVYYGAEPLKAEPWEQFVRSLSFSPARISGIREKQWNEKQVAAKYTEKRRDIIEEMKHYYLTGSGNFDSLMVEVMHYNDLVRGSGRMDIPYLTPRTIRQAVIQGEKPSKTERMRVE